MAVKLLHKDDPDSLFVPASDTKGHNVSTSFRMPPVMKHQLGKLCQSKKFPLSTEGEIVRAAIMKFLPDAVEKYSVPSLLGQIEAMRTVITEEAFGRSYMDIFRKLSEEVTALLADGSADQARHVIGKVEACIGSIPDGYWKDRYVKELRTKFGYLMEKRAE